MSDEISQPRAGVWVHRTGTRVEVAEHPDGWHVAVFPFRHGGRPGAELVLPADEAREKIAAYEAQGYIRAPDRTPGEAPPSQWTPGNVVGALLLFVVLMAVGMWIIGG